MKVDIGRKFLIIISDPWEFKEINGFDSFKAKVVKVVKVSEDNFLIYTELPLYC